MSDPVQSWSCLILIRVSEFVTEKKKEKDKTYFYGFRLKMILGTCWTTFVFMSRLKSRCLSKTIEIRFVLLLLLLLRNEFRHSDQDQTRSVLDRIRHDQGFPNLWRKMASWGWIFRHEFGKPWSCLILSSTDRVWSWSECLNSWRRRRRSTKRISKGLDCVHWTGFKCHGRTNCNPKIGFG